MMSTTSTTFPPTTSTAPTPATTIKRVATTAAPPVSTTTVADAAVNCSWRQQLYPRDPYDESSSDSMRFDVTSAQIAGQPVHFAVGYVGPGDFPRASRPRTSGDNHGHAQLVVSVGRDNEGGTIHITVWLVNDPERRCSSPDYTVHFPN
jgi:hypothetical protein